MKDMLAGFNSVVEAMQGSRQVLELLVQEGVKNHRTEQLLRLARAKSVQVRWVSKAKLDEIYGLNRHQGILAYVEPYTYATLDDILIDRTETIHPPVLLILDGIEDPQNLGSIIRTAECAGVGGVILPRRHSAEITESVVRSSAGAAEHVKIVQETNLVNVIKRLKTEGYWVVGADAQGKDIYDPLLDIPQPAAIVIGGEGRGIRRLVKENCDILLKIPMAGRLNSLNASVAAALIIYEILRRCHKS